MLVNWIIVVQYINKDPIFEFNYSLEVNRVLKIEKEKIEKERNYEEKILNLKITLNWVKTHQNENKEIYEKKLEGLKNNLII